MVQFHIIVTSSFLFDGHLHGTVKRYYSRTSLVRTTGDRQNVFTLSEFVLTVFEQMSSTVVFFKI